MGTEKKMQADKRKVAPLDLSKIPHSERFRLHAVEQYARWQLWIEIARQSKWWILGLSAVAIAWALRGQVTVAQFAAAILYNNGVDWMPWVLFGLSTALNVSLLSRQGQRIKLFAQREKGLELQIDPKRESSGILPTGQTNPEDDI